MEKNVLEIRNVSFSYKENPAGGTVLKDICFALPAGERVGLIGSNGVGKSTLLKLLTGILVPDEGSIRICGMEAEKKNWGRIRKRMGYVFQDSDSQLFMPTVYADVSFAPRNYGYSEEEVEKLTENALRTVHMEASRDKQIYRLSGGEKKLAAIAGILALGPELILMDEPSAALDPKNRRNLIRILNGLPAAQIIASHDLDFIYDTCSRVILLYDGKIEADRKAEEILRNRRLLEQCDLELPLRFQAEK